MLIHFDAVRLDRGEAWRWRPWTLPELKRVFSEQERLMGRTAWRTLCLSNHDNPRLVSHFGDDRPQWRVRSAIALATLLMTLKGTPFVIHGRRDRGMNELIPSARIEDYDDVEAKGAWRAEEWRTGGVTRGLPRRMAKTTATTPATPMQWGRLTPTPALHHGRSPGSRETRNYRRDQTPQRVRRRRLESTSRPTIG